MHIYGHDLRFSTQAFAHAGTETPHLAGVGAIRRFPADIFEYLTVVFTKRKPFGLG
jgi:hypothetical protein